MVLRRVVDSGSCGGVVGFGVWCVGISVDHLGCSDTYGSLWYGFEFPSKSCGRCVAPACTSVLGGGCIRCCWIWYHVAFGCVKASGKVCSYHGVLSGGGGGGLPKWRYVVLILRDCDSGHAVCPNCSGSLH